MHVRPYNWADACVPTHRYEHTGAPGWLLLRRYGLVTATSAVYFTEFHRASHSILTSGSLGRFTYLVDVLYWTDQARDDSRPRTPSSVVLDV